MNLIAAPTSQRHNLSLTGLFLGLITLISPLASADKVDEFLLAKMKQKNIPGMQLAVIKDNKIIKTANYGIANLQDNIAVTKNTLFTINSMTKSFAGVAIMQLAEQGKLTLDDRISLHLTKLPRDWQGVTIRQLLSHTSGLPEITQGIKLISPQGEQASWDLVKTLPLLFPANTRFHYNSTNYLLIGKLIEQLSGQSFVEFISQHQLDKVGMKKTRAAGFAHFQGVIPNQARGYTYYLNHQLTTIQAEIPPFLRVSAGMSSNTEELSLWLTALQNGSLITQKSLTQLWSPATLKNGQIAGFNHYLNGYGLGWQFIYRQQHPAILSVGGDRSALAFYPDEKITVILLTNLMGTKPEFFIDEVAGFYSKSLDSINGKDLDLSQLDDYVGNFDFDKFTIQVARQGKRLLLQASGKGQQAFTIYAESSNLFWAKEMQATFSFERDQQGKVKTLLFHQAGVTYKGTITRQ